MRNLKRLKKAIGAILAAAVAVCMLVSLGMTGVSAEASNLLLNKRAVISGADRFDFNYDSTDAAKNGVNLTDGNDANQLMLWRKVENAGFTPDQVYDIETIFTWDLGAAYDLTGYKLIPAFQHHGWVLEVSSNGSTWESAAAVTDSGWAESANFSKGNIRHIRVTFNKAKATDVDAQMLQIKEIELYGTPYVAPATTTTTEEAVTTTTEAVTSTTNEASKGNLIYGKLPTLSGADQFDFSSESVDGNKNGAFLTDGSEEDGRHLMLWRKDEGAGYTQDSMVDIETVLTWDLGWEYDLESYKLIPRYEHYAWKLELSRDGKTWTTADTEADGTWSKEVTFKSLQKNVRYVRFTFTKALAVTSDELMLQIKEVYVNAKAVSATKPSPGTGEAAVVLPIALVTGGALIALSAAMVLKRRSRES